MCIYYLYVKTHNITGLKYFGFTKQKDYHKYTGSGTYWLLHLKKHGFNYSTTIVFESNNKSDIKLMGEQLSTEWNIVASDEWANLKPESGDGGFLLTTESHQKRINTRKIRGNLNTNTNDSIRKSIETKKKNGTLNVQTAEVIAKSLETKRKNNTMNANTPESIIAGLETKRKNGTLGKTNSTKESIEKANITKYKNGTNKRSADSIQKQKETIKKNGGKMHSEETLNKLRQPKSLLTCPYCHKTGGSNGMSRYHFSKCKLHIT